jgi:hypothetical protein
MAARYPRNRAASRNKSDPNRRAPSLRASHCAAERTGHLDLDQFAAAAVPEICRAHGASAEHFVAELSALDALVRDGLVLRHGSEIRVPPQARAAVRAACAVFDQYAADGDARYSRAS